jgi:hypothetical protein
MISAKMGDLSERLFDIFRSADFLSMRAQANEVRCSFKPMT